METKDKAQEKAYKSKGYSIGIHLKELCPSYIDISRDRYIFITCAEALLTASATIRRQRPNILAEWIKLVHAERLYLNLLCAFISDKCMTITISIEKYTLE